MSVRADWGTSALAEPQAASEPDVGPQAMTDATGIAVENPVDLNSSESELESWLQELLSREGELFDCGTSCPLKDMPDGNCTACPVSRARETTGDLSQFRLSNLCRLGAEQERVAMLLLAKRHRGF